MTFHWLRPEWLWMLIPVIVIFIYLWKNKSQTSAWNNVCDAHLLPHLITHKGTSHYRQAISLIFLSCLCLCLSLAGPTWKKLPVPTYHLKLPRVVLLDMSATMLDNDLTPDRLSRAKFKLHDLFVRADAGQLAMIAYTGEPFVVSPVTEDGKTIDALLDSLTPDIMPVNGDNLSSALDEAANLIRSAGFSQGQILVFTSTPPDATAIDTAKQLAEKNIITSVSPVVADTHLGPLFKPLAEAGDGWLLPFSSTSDDLDTWLKNISHAQSYRWDKNDLIPTWQDEGRWFLLPALLLLLPVFRRGWLQRINR